MVRVGSLSVGTQFRTAASERPGKVLGFSCVDLGPDGVERSVEVRLLAPGQIKDLHPLVLVEVIH